MKNCKTNNLNLNFWATAAVALTKAHFDEAAVNVNFENAAKGDCRSRLESTEYKAKHKSKNITETGCLISIANVL